MSFPAFEPPPDPAAMMGGGMPGMQEQQQPDPMQGMVPARIPEAVDYTVRLSPDRRAALARRVCAEISHYRAATERRRQNQRDWKRADKMMPTPALTDEQDEKGWHSEGTAPFSRIARQQHTTRLNGQILTGAPPFGVVCRKATITINDPQMGPQELPLAELTGQIEEALTALLEEADWKSCARILHMLLPRDGAAAVECVWKRETVWAPVAGLREFDDEQAALLMEAGVEPQEAMLGAAATTADGQLALEVQHEERVLCEGVELTCITADDLIMLPATAKTRKDLWGIGKKLTLRGMDLKEGARQGLYLKAAVREMLDLHGDPVLGDGDEDDGEFTGVEPVEGSASPESELYRQYQCAEVYLLDDLDRSGKLKWYLVGVHLEREKVYRLQYMPYEHGRPPITPFSYIEDSLVGESIIEILAVLQDVGTRLFNDIVDLSRLIAAQGTSLLVDETMGLDPDMITLVPGSVVGVQRLEGGVKEFPMHPAAGQAMQHNLATLDVVKNWGDLVAATSNVSLGKETDTQKTLGEINQVASAAASIFEDLATLVALRWAEVADQVRWLAAQYAEGGKVQYRKAASASVEFRDLPKEVLLAAVDLVPAGLNAFPGAEQRLQRDMMVMQVLGGHPLTSGNWPLQARLLTQLLQDAKWPGWQLIEAALQQAAVQMQMQEQMMAMAEAGAAQAQGAMQEGDARRADEQHQDQRATGQLQRAGQVRELLTPPEKANGARKK